MATTEPKPGTTTETSPETETTPKTLVEFPPKPGKPGDVEYDYYNQIKQISSIVDLETLMGDIEKAHPDKEIDFDGMMTRLMIIYGDISRVMNAELTKLEQQRTEATKSLPPAQFNDESIESQRRKIELGMLRNKAAEIANRIQENHDLLLGKSTRYSESSLALAARDYLSFTRKNEAGTLPDQLQLDKTKIDAITQQKETLPWYKKILPSKDRTQLEADLTAANLNLEKTEALKKRIEDAITEQEKNRSKITAEILTNEKTVGQEMQINVNDPVRLAHRQAEQAYIKARNTLLETDVGKAWKQLGKLLDELRKQENLERGY